MNLFTGMTSLNIAHHNILNVKVSCETLWWNDWCRWKYWDMLKSLALFCRRGSSNRWRLEHLVLLARFVQGVLKVEQVDVLPGVHHIGRNFSVHSNRSATPLLKLLSAHSVLMSEYHCHSVLVSECPWKLCTRPFAGVTTYLVTQSCMVQWPIIRWHYLRQSWRYDFNKVWNDGRHIRIFGHGTLSGDFIPHPNYAGPVRKVESRKIQFSLRIPLHWIERPSANKPIVLFLFQVGVGESRYTFHPIDIVGTHHTRVL